MKRFKYSLQQVLDMQEQEKKNSSLKYKGASSEYERQNAKLKEMHRQLSEFIIKKRQIRSGKLDHDLLMIAEAYELLEKDREAAQLLVVKEAEKEMLAAQERLQEACRKEKILQRLKEKHWKQYYQEFLRAEQKDLDEIGNLGYWRGT